MGYKLVEPALDAQLPESKSPQTGLVKTVLIALCNRADNELHTCYPSISDLVRRSQASRATVKRSIYLLESYGLISVQRRKVEGTKENTSNFYTIHLDKVRSRGTDPKVKENRPLVQGEPLGRVEERQKPVNEPVIKPESIKHPLPSDFSISSDMKDWFSKKGFAFDIQEVTEKFTNHALANGSKQFDWKAAWRNWMLKEYNPKTFKQNKSNAKTENFSGYGETQF